ncbi:metalloregulator ArsR/SmtB family transcription factor [Nonomuraea sp. NPDC050202]|uniref:ArsR/SmtB family transcription factor n=1 Tax=Nonomuraea sp. NPDC050202 TaxID=3155035 RepID=UPI0033FCC1A7
MREDRCELLCLDLPRAEAVRAQLPQAAGLAAPAERAKALADETRLRIALALRAGGELCVCDLAWVCGLAQNLVSHHLRVLRAAGLAASRREGKLVIYALTDAGRGLLAVLMGTAAPASP